MRAGKLAIILAIEKCEVVMERAYADLDEASNNIKYAEAVLTQKTRQMKELKIALKKLK